VPDVDDRRRARGAAQATTEEILRELAALRAEVRQLREELDTLKAPAQDIVHTQLADLAQTKVESMTRFPLKIFGTIYAHAFAISAAPNWLDIPNLVGAAPADPGTFSMGLRQTRIGFTADGPTIGSVRTSGVAAFDFFGGSLDFKRGRSGGCPVCSSRMLGLMALARGAGRPGPGAAGAARSALHSAVLPFRCCFVRATFYLHAPHARLELKMAPLLRAAAGIVAPIGGDLTVEDYRFVPPALGGERSRRPGAQARGARIG
jgi:hypothetical protein